MTFNTGGSNVADEGQNAQAEDVCYREGCLMAPAHGPFAEKHGFYQALGWEGTLRLDSQSKDKGLPYGFTGTKNTDVWPSESDLHSWSHESNTNIALRMPSNVIGIDVDQYVKKGQQKKGHDRLLKLEERLGKLPMTWRSSRRGADNPSGIRFFRVPEGQNWPGVVDIDIEVIQHKHRYAVVWPSVVPDGETGLLLAYRWYGPDGQVTDEPPGVEDLPDLPQEWVAFLLSQGHSSTTADVRSGDYPQAVEIPDEVAVDAPWYIKALAKPGADGRGNQTMVSIAGGIAKMFVGAGLPYEAALATMLGYERSSDDPQDDSVVTDRLQHFWAVETAKKRERTEAESVGQGGLFGPSEGAPGALTTGVAPMGGVNEGEYFEEQGWLAPRADGKVGYTTMIMVPGGKNGPKPEAGVFSDFEVEVTGVIEEENGGNRRWVVDLIRHDGTVRPDVEIPARVLASTNNARAWLMDWGCDLIASDDRSKFGPMGSRLNRYLKGQNPPSVELVDHLGWHDRAQGFITYEGVITAEGVKTGSPFRPSKQLMTNGLVNHYYGFTKGEEATREVLKEVLTFHDETFTSVHASWMCATVLKGHMMNKSSLFPIFLVEAASESGKTEGYAQLIKHLFGNLNKKEGTGTRASTRNALTAHRGAPVRIDDATSLEHIEEMLRQVPNEGSMEKSGDDNRTTVRARLVAPLWISCEGSNLRNEKAMSDRVIYCTLPNPRDRKSLRHPERSQWEDIIALKDAHDGGAGLTQFAGTLVQMILKNAHLVEEFASLRGVGGRHNDKMAVIRIGARVLSAITGDDSHVKRVDAFCAEQIDTGDENALTKKVIPAALKALNCFRSKPQKVKDQPHFNLATPVLLFEGAEGRPEMWVNLGNLAQWWDKYNNGRVAQRTETASALKEQAARIGMRGDGNVLAVRGQDWRQFSVTDAIGQNTGQKANYLRVPLGTVVQLMEREGISLEDSDYRGTSKLSPGQQEGIGNA